VEQICGGMSVFPTAEKTMSVLVNLILPLCIRMGGGSNRTGTLVVLIKRNSVCIGDTVNKHGTDRRHNYLYTRQTLSLGCHIHTTVLNYLFNAILETNHDANHTNPSNSTNPSARYRCEYGTQTQCLPISIHL